MNTGLSTNNPAIVSAFKTALLHQGLVVLLIIALISVAWNVQRSAQLRRARSGGTGTSNSTTSRPEPVARRLLRISFGLIWVFDGILQGQASMPLGMVPQVVQPTTAVSPTWVQHLVNAAATVWSYHPVTAAAAAVWIQLGVGAWLLAAPRGDWSRLGGVVSVVWGLNVWIFGETFGGIFAPGLSWLEPAASSAGVKIGLRSRRMLPRKRGKLAPPVQSAVVASQPNSWSFCSGVQPSCSKRRQ